MLSVKNTIEKNKLFKREEIIGVACSGGIDSMSLLHYLVSKKDELDIDVVAININHCIRENSEQDSLFVSEYCKEHKIRCYKFKVDALKVATDNKIGIEEAARIARYGMFDALIQKGIVDKIALGHHLQDQAETVLLNLFRGCGLKGASGMEVKNKNYVRPMLFTTKEEIKTYTQINDIPYVEDETNFSTEYSRNFLRNCIMPQLRKRWNNIDSNLINFAGICKEDDAFITKQISYDNLIYEDKETVRVATTYFAYQSSIVNRVLRHCFEYLGLRKDIEKKHLDLIKNMVKEAKNGTKISLPNGLKAHLEYDYLTLSVVAVKAKPVPKNFKCGKIMFDKYGIATIKKASVFDVSDLSKHIIDVKKLPKTAVWRFRENGDMFTKFGGGTKKLKDYFIDIKVPARLRGNVPVLADGNEVYCVLGYEISDKVKTDKNTKQAYVVSLQKNN